MQSSSSYRNYPFYPQNVYNQNPYQNPNNTYPPVAHSYYPQPQNTIPFIPPPPPPPAASSYDAAPENPRSRSKRSRRAPSTPVATPFPLKSAMKKPAPTPEAPLMRPRTHSKTHPNRPETLSRRQRANSNAQTEPLGGNHAVSATFHMFVSFRGNNELRVENISEVARAELRERILPMWQHGTQLEEIRGYHWIVKFNNAPWDLRGADASVACNMILELFTLFTIRGFTYRTSMDSGTPYPRLIFAAQEGDMTPGFFLAYFSRGGRRVTLIQPPANIDVSLGALLKAAFPQKIASDHVVDDQLRVIEVKGRRGFGGPSGGEVDPAYFMVHVLRVILDLGYDLRATVPLTRPGPLGLLSRKKELLVFKSTGYASP